MRILITGVAGFIGYHLARRLLIQGEWVYGVDNLSNTYDVQLKKDRLAQLQDYKQFKFQLLDLADRTHIAELFQVQTFDIIIHLAVQEHLGDIRLEPQFWLNSSLSGFYNLLEECRHFPVEHLIFASSGSVYGANLKLPFAVSDRADAPTTLEAVAHRVHELIAHVYSYQYQLPITGLRLFTVYGPWGRPDMDYFKFVQAIEQGQPIHLHNFGRMQRDWIYIDDVIEGILRLLDQPPKSGSSLSPDHNTQDQPELIAMGGFIETKYINGCGPYLYRRYRTSDGKQRSQYLGKGTKNVTLVSAMQPAPYKIYNFGSSCALELSRLIEIIEITLGKRAQKQFIELPPTEMITTCAAIDDLVQEVDYQPTVSITEGIQRFIHWYRDYVTP